MFGSAYVLDVISDGEQIFDSGIIPTREIADVAYTVVVKEHKDRLTDDSERTVRLIRDGEILAESTIRGGAVLDSLDRR